MREQRRYLLGAKVNIVQECGRTVRNRAGIEIERMDIGVVV